MISEVCILLLRSQLSGSNRLRSLISPPACVIYTTMSSLETIPGELFIEIVKNLDDDDKRVLSLTNKTIRYRVSPLPWMIQLSFDVQAHWSARVCRLLDRHRKNGYEPCEYCHEGYHWTFLSMRSMDLSVRSEHPGRLSA